jgi:hypothetical protein
MGKQKRNKMDNLTFRDITKMARENELTVLVKDGKYVLCDEHLQTLASSESLRKICWFINNCEILGIVKV